MNLQPVDGVLRIGNALLQAHAVGVDRLDAQWLMLHVLNGPLQSAPQPSTNLATRSWLLVHDDQALSTPQAQRWQVLLARRASGEPLAYVVGEQVFCGLTLQVSPAVLIPRPETEMLVQWALECLAAGTALQPCVLDLGTGSGAVALAIKSRLPAAQLHATDVSPQALAVARGNALRLNLPLHFSSGSWWQALPHASGAFDLVISNPPYVAPGDAHLQALRHEPRLALVGSDDGLGDLRQIISGARQHLRPGAWLLLEHGHDQASHVQALLHAAGLQQVQTRADLAGLPRCTGAQV